MVSSNYSNVNQQSKYPTYYEPSADLVEKLDKSHDHLIPSNILTHSQAALIKTKDAFTTYPKKGLKGDQNFNFYEFLALGTVATIVGSLTMIGIFNGASKKFSPTSQKEALKIGKKLGVGVVLYFLGKELAKKIVDTPIQMATGVDLEQPYKRIIHELPPNGYQKGKTRIEYHKAFESADFPRWDLFHDEGNKHGNRNEYFDKIAKKNGYGELNASDQEMKPKIKSLLIKAQTWKTILGYTMAATAVGLAAQTPWEELFVSSGNKSKAVLNAPKHVLSMLGRSFQEMWKGGARNTKTAGVIGKALLIASAVGAVVAPLASMSGFRADKYTKETVDESKRYYSA